MPDPTRQEDDWFRQHEKALLDEARRGREKRERERASKETDEERKRLRELHWMRCPKCGHALEAVDMAGVEVDRCTFCEGVYMDAGELETLFAKQMDERRGFFRKLLRV